MHANYSSQSKEQTKEFVRVPEIYFQTLFMYGYYSFNLMKSCYVEMYYLTLKKMFCEFLV